MSNPSPRPLDLIPIAASGVLGLALAGAGLRMLLTGQVMGMFAVFIALTGVLAVVLAVQVWRGNRAAWAFLVATWGVVAFCAFFTAPKVLDLDQLKQVTPEMELSLGRAKAEAKIDDENLNIRLTNLGVSTLFAAPFIAACVALARRGRDVAPRRS